MFYELSYEVDREKMMDDFIKNDCVACGGNWTAMIISGIKNRFCWLYDEMDDNKSYSFIEVCDMVYNAIDEIIDGNICNNNMYLREQLGEKMLQYGEIIGEYHRNNAYVGCDNYVIKYLNKYFELNFVDGMIISLVETDREHGEYLHRQNMLRKYE